MKKLRVIWSRFAAMFLAILMALGMAGCGKQPATPVNDGTAGQENAQPQDQEQTTDGQENAQSQDQEQLKGETGDEEEEENQNKWELPEHVFDETSDGNPSNEDTSDDKPSDHETSSNKDFSEIVLPEDVWE